MLIWKKSVDISCTTTTVELIRIDVAGFFHATEHICSAVQQLFSCNNTLIIIFFLGGDVREATDILSPYAHTRSPRLFVPPIFLFVNAFYRLFYLEFIKHFFAVTT